MQTFIETLMTWIQLIAIIFFFGLSLNMERKITKWKLARALNFLEDIEDERND